MQEKIARSLISKEQDLAGSFYGKFFAKNLNIYLLRRRPEEWRNLQTERRHPEKSTTELGDNVTLSSVSDAKRKRKNRSEDEIDVLFDKCLPKKVKKVALTAIPSPIAALNDKLSSLNEDRDLEEVLGAIQMAPKRDPIPKGNKEKGR